MLQNVNALLCVRNYFGCNQIARHGVLTNYFSVETGNVTRLLLSTYSHTTKPKCIVEVELLVNILIVPVCM